MSGRLSVIGLGPAGADMRTPEAEAALAAASDLFGYGPYLDRVSLRADQRAHASDNRVEGERARAALELAASGASVAMVTGGDPGVFAMAAAVCEEIEQGPEAWRALEVSFIPGITAMLAVAAKVGAPLGHDFCAISLSDNLKPWDLVLKRLTMAAQAGFVIALYNVRSKARPWQLGAAFEVLRAELPPTVPVIFGRAAGRADQAMVIVDLAQADAEIADMATCVIIGSPETRVIERPGLAPLVYSPRSVGGTG
ncbi:precorrin-3B C(17)-methyltransferase [Lacibacterium aquatile]|uniref:Precorrin-3B C(17)-methyltransferase n=1 Tax=Lacibacterium aquatile TaxID=1168082 RepID=A0ABW5DTS6_9PROT